MALKYVKYEKLEFEAREPQNKSKLFFELSADPDSLSLSNNGTSKGSVSISTNSGSNLSVDVGVSTLISLNGLSNLIFTSSLFAFGLDDFAIEFRVCVASHTNIYPYLLASAPYNSGSGFYCIVFGTTTGWATPPNLGFYSSTNLPAGSRVSLLSVSELRNTGFNHVAIVRRGLVHELYINGNLEATSVQTIKTNYSSSGSASRFNSDSDGSSGGNEIRLQDFRVYRGTSVAVRYDNRSVCANTQKIRSNKRLFGNPKSTSMAMRVSQRLQSTIFSIDSRTLRNSMAVGAKVQSIQDLSNSGLRSPFQTDQAKKPFLNSRLFLEFDGVDDVMVLPIPLNDSQLPINQYRISFYVLEAFVVKGAGARSVLGSSTNPTKVFGVSNSTLPNYKFSCGNNKEIWGVMQESSSLIAVPNKFLLTEIVRDGYCSFRLNGKPLTTQLISTNANYLSQQYSLDVLGAGYAGGIGEIQIFSFSSLSSLNLEKVENYFFRKWNIDESLIDEEHFYGNKIK